MKKTIYYAIKRSNYTVVAEAMSTPEALRLGYDATDEDVFVYGTSNPPQMCSLCAGDGVLCYYEDHQECHQCDGSGYESFPWDIKEE